MSASDRKKADPARRLRFLRTLLLVLAILSSPSICCGFFYALDALPPSMLPSEFSFVLNLFEAQARVENKTSETFYLTPITTTRGRPEVIPQKYSFEQSNIRLQPGRSLELAYDAADMPLSGIAVCREKEDCRLLAADPSGVYPLDSFERLPALEAGWLAAIQSSIPINIGMIFILLAVLVSISLFLSWWCVAKAVRYKAFISSPLLLMAIALLIAAGASLPRVSAAPEWVPPPRAPAGSPRQVQAPAPSAVSCSEPGVTCVYLPLIARDGSNSPERQYASDLYHNVYLLPTPAMGWTGSYSACRPGTTSQAWRDAILTRINYFREMAGVPKAVRLLDAYNTEAQAAALIMGAQGNLSHDPPTDWACWTQLGRDGAASSNLYLGRNGPEAISGYMDDNGILSMGHRRWIIYPQTQDFGTGDLPGDAGHMRSNALHVFDQAHMWGPRPPVRDDFIAWPPPVYVPYPLVFAYWSFSYPAADFSTAAVSVRIDGAGLGITVYPQQNGYGENTLVWKINSLSSAWPKPAADTPVTVSIANVLVGGLPRRFTYTVTIFDPDH